LYLVGGIKDSSLTNSVSMWYPFALRIASGGDDFIFAKYYIDSDGLDHSFHRMNGNAALGTAIVTLNENPLKFMILDLSNGNVISYLIDTSTYSSNL
jgi:hypothetical protein